MLADRAQSANNRTRSRGRFLGCPTCCSAGLSQAYQIGIERGLSRAVYVRAMFSTGHDAANRAAFKAEPANAPNLVGVALRGAKKDVDTPTKGLSLHR